MAFCPSCGAQNDGAFCIRCGTPVAGAAPPQPQPPRYSQPAPAAAGLDENIAAALCYFLGLITGILFLVLEPFNKNRTIRFHAFQSIFFNVAYIVLWIGMTIAFSILRNIFPFGFWFLFSAMSGLIWLGSFCLWLFLMYKAYNREKFKLPVIGDLAEKQA